MNSRNDRHRLAYLGLGANLGEAQAAIRTAIAKLENQHLTVSRQAHLYRSPPMGPQDQPDFINTVIEVKTSLPPQGLLTHLQEIEQFMGRTPTRHWGPRVIDLDLLLYENLIVDEADLQIPHPHMHLRRFVLEPLAELAPDFVIPGLDQTVQALVGQLEDPAIHQIA